MRSKTKVIYWTISIYFLVLGLVEFFGLLQRSQWWDLFRLTRRQKLDLEIFVAKIQDLQSLLESGCALGAENWQEFDGLDAVWKEILISSVQRNREKGQPLLPLLKRLKIAASEHLARIYKSTNLTAQPKAQAWVGAFMAPFFGLVLYELLPELQSDSLFWFFICAFTGVFSIFGVLWIYKQADHAAWGGLTGEKKVWLYLAPAALESIQSHLVCGLPADMAWQESQSWMIKRNLQLAEVMGQSIWASEDHINKGKGVSSDLESKIKTHFNQIKTSIRMAMLEGHRISERMDLAQKQLSILLTTHLEGELAKLPTRALIPLFFSVFPGALILICAAIVMVWTESGGF